jgi:hypothetical protein
MVCPHSSKPSIAIFHRIAELLEAAFPASEIAKIPGTSVNLSVFIETKGTLLGSSRNPELIVAFLLRAYTTGQ